MKSVVIPKIIYGLLTFTQSGTVALLRLTSCDHLDDSRQNEGFQPPFAIIEGNPKPLMHEKVHIRLPLYVAQ